MSKHFVFNCILIVLDTVMIFLITMAWMGRPVQHRFSPIRTFDTYGEHNLDTLTGFWGQPLWVAIMNSDTNVELYGSTMGVNPEMIHFDTVLMENQTVVNEAKGADFIRMEAHKGSEVVVTDGMAFVTCFACSVTVHPTLLGWILLLVPALTVGTLLAIANKKYWLEQKAKPV